MSRYLLVAIAVLALLAGQTLARGGGRTGGGGRGGGRGGGSRGGGWGGSRSTGHASGGHGSTTHPTGSGKSWFSWPWSRSSSTSHTYPASTGLSGNNAGHAYPPSGGLSGHGAGGAPPPYGFKAPVPGVGHQPPVYHSQSANPSHGSSVSSLGTGGYHYTGSNTHPTGYNTGSMPQANPYPVYGGPTPIYVQQVRDSGSRYSDIMTGLALWNLGRSHSHHHYYHHGYSTNHNHSSNSNTNKTSPPTPAPVPRADVNCTLKMSSPNYTEILNVPCDMVSTFMPNDTQASSGTMKNNATYNVTTSTKVPATSAPSNPHGNGTSAMPPLVGDPLKVPGSKFAVPDNMTCTIEVRSPRSFESTTVACGVLLQYSDAERVKNAPTPPVISSMAPSKAQVRRWYDAPPFWLVVPFML